MGEGRATEGRIAAAITAGELDDELPAIAAAINLRYAAIDRARTARALTYLHVGARVVIGTTAKPKYLRGLTGEVHEIVGDDAVVCLDTPVGRFTSGHIRCPVALLEPLRT